MNQEILDKIELASMYYEVGISIREAIRKVQNLW